MSGHRLQFRASLSACFASSTWCHYRLPATHRRVLVVIADPEQASARDRLTPTELRRYCRADALACGESRPPDTSPVQRTAVPVPMATPMSAFRSAGASLTPSPVMATTCPWRAQSAQHFGTSGGGSSRCVPWVTPVPQRQLVRREPQLGRRTAEAT